MKVCVCICLRPTYICTVTLNGSLVPGKLSCTSNSWKWNVRRHANDFFFLPPGLGHWQSTVKKGHWMNTYSKKWMYLGRCHAAARARWWGLKTEQTLRKNKTERKPYLRRLGSGAHARRRLKTTCMREKQKQKTKDLLGTVCAPEKKTMYTKSALRLNKKQCQKNAYLGRLRRRLRLKNVSQKKRDCKKKGKRKTFTWGGSCRIVRGD
jgi:hypothetical protein